MLAPILLEGADVFSKNVCAKGWDFESSREFYKKYGNEKVVKMIYD